MRRGRRKDDQATSVGDRLNGFGMPPDETDLPGKTIAVSGAGSSGIGAAIAGSSTTTETQADEGRIDRTHANATATEEFKDKCLNLPLFSKKVALQGNGEVPDVPGDRSSLVVGNLKRHISFWEKINAGDFILSTIREGYKIPFYATPHSAYFKNNQSALKHSDFVSKEIRNLLDTGRIREVSQPPTVVNPLSVATNSSKPRLILDLRYVNSHLWSQRVKYEDFRTFRHYLKKEAFMFSFDLKSGYHHIEIFDEHWQYLGFSWTERGVTRFYVFLVLPFGLATAGYIFTKVVRVLVRFWRSLGIKIVVFLDDGIGVGETEVSSREIAQVVKSSIDDAGFIANEEKSVWDPVQCLTWLGLVINTNPLSLCITPKRMKKLFSKIDDALAHPEVSARQISAISGSIRSQEIVLGQITALFSRNMHRFVADSASWDAKRSITGRVREELRFWRMNAEALNMKALERQSGPPVELTIKANSDASAIASGAIIKVGKVSHAAHKNLSLFETTLSSTWRELDAIRFALASFSPRLKGSSVVWATDNDPAVKIMTKGSRKPHLHALAVDIYHICRNNLIDFHPVWVPREFNCEADALSKLMDTDDWTTSQDFFAFVNQRWGTFTIDRFANNRNSKTSRFNSKLWNPGCEAADAFSQDWGNDTNWLVPPIHMICRVIHHARRCRAKGALLVPLWRSAAYWPLLFTDDRKAQPWILDSFTFHNTGGILQLGDFKGSLLGSSRFRSPLVIVHFDFEETSRSGGGQQCRP